MTRSRAHLAFTLTVALSALPARAGAQAAIPAPAPAANEGVAQARSHFLRGVKLYEEDDFRAALIEFSRAYELAPNWAVLYNIGQSYYQLRDYANALRTLERYVKEGGEKIEKDRRTQVDRELEELRGRVAHVTFKANVDGAEVTLDDAVIGKTPFAEPYPVGAGRHRLSIAKGGYVTSSKVVDIAGGDNVSIDLPLAEAEHAGATEAGPALATSSPNYAPAIVAASVGAVGIVVGTVFGVMAIGNKSSLDNDGCASKVCPRSAQNDINSFNTNTTVSTVGFVVGGVGVAAGTVLFLLARKSGGEATPQPATGAAERRAPVAGTITPWIGAGAAGISGTF